MKKKTKHRIFAVTLSLLVALGLVEGVASILLGRASRKPRFPDAMLAEVCLRDRGVRTAPDPYVLFRNLPDQDGAYAATNRFGLRGGPVSESPEPGVLRVLFLGGSVAWGYAARSAEEAIPALLEEYLQAHRNDHPLGVESRFEVLNAGVPAYVSWQETLAYARHLRTLRPHVIVTLDGANDVYAAIRTGEAGWPQRLVNPRDRYLVQEPTLLGSLTNWLRYRLSRLKSVRYWQATHPAAIAAYAPPSPQLVAGAYRQGQTLLADLAATDEAVLVSVLQPMAILEPTKPLTPYEAEIVAWHEAGMPGVNAYYNDCYGAIRDLSGSIFRAHPNALWMDASQVFAEEAGLVYTDHCHLTPQGRQLLAATIGQQILTRALPLVRQP